MDKTFTIDGTEVKVQDYLKSQNAVSFKLNGKDYQFHLINRSGQELLLDNGSRFKAAVGSINKDGESMVMAQGREASVSSSTQRTIKVRTHAGGLTSPMPGKIFKVVKEAGSKVKKGDTIVILEAMKMEHSIRSDKDGKVKKVFFKVGELVQGGVLLAEVE